MSKKVFKLFALALTAALLAVLCVGCGSEDIPDNIKATDPVRATLDVDVTAVLPLPTPSPEPTPTPEPTPPQVVQLPELDTVTVENNPLLYDFMNGCVGWHVNVFAPTGWEGSTVILRHKSTPDILYTDVYRIQDVPTLPPNGSVIDRIELNVAQLEAYEKVLDSSPSSYIFTEGDWELLVYGRENRDVLISSGLRLRVSDDTAQGNPRPFLEDGTGWPTEWLRREPYVSRIKENLGIDMTDSFWDIWNYKGEYELKKSWLSKGDYQVWVRVDGVNDFYEWDSDGYTNEHLDWDQVKEMCWDDYRDIDGILNTSAT